MMHEIRRIVPNISSNKLDESRRFYADFLGLIVVMDMKWILTFASGSNPTAQVSIVQSNNTNSIESPVTISIEVPDVDKLYEKAKLFNYEIIYEIINEPRGVRRFFVKDPNGVIINIMMHII
jgi:predicted enzyme related to lactoylglutathione lyase